MSKTLLGGKEFILTSEMWKIVGNGNTDIIRKSKDFCCKKTHDFSNESCLTAIAFFSDSQKGSLNAESTRKCMNILIESVSIWNYAIKSLDVTGREDP
jgi:hypothetical protein